MPSAPKQNLDAPHHASEPCDMSEHIRRRYQRRMTMRLDNPAGEVFREEALQRFDSGFIGKPSDVRRFDAEHPLTLLLESREERAVIGSDVNDERFQREPVLGCGRCRDAALMGRELARYAGTIWIGRVKHRFRINDII